MTAFNKSLAREFMPGMDDIFAFNSCETNPPLTSVDFAKGIVSTSSFAPAAGAALASDQVAVGALSLKVPLNTLGFAQSPLTFAYRYQSHIALSKRQFTLAFWYRISAFPTIGSYHWCGNITGPSQRVQVTIGAGALGVADGTGRITVRVRNAAFTPNEYFFATTSAIILSDGNFHFYETQYDDVLKQVRFYRDNVLIETLATTSSNTLTNLAGYFYVGNLGGNSNPIEGWYDNIFAAVSARRRFWQWRNITDFRTVINRENGQFFIPYLNVKVLQNKAGVISPVGVSATSRIFFRSVFATLNPFQALAKYSTKKIFSGLFGTNGFVPLLNGGFELGDTSGWSISGGIFSVQNTLAHAGTYRLQMLCSQSYGGTIVAKTFTGYQIGDTIVFSGFYKSDHPNGTFVSIYDGVNGTYDFLPNTGANWEKFELTYVLEDVNWTFEFYAGYNPFSATVYETQLDSNSLFLSRQIEPNRGAVNRVIQRLINADVDYISTMFPQIGNKWANLAANLDFLSTLKRVDDDGRCLVSYDEELAELIVETLEAEALLNTTGASCVPIILTELEEQEISFIQDNPSPLIIFNADQPCCTGLVAQTLSGDPPSPGSEVTFGGIIGSMLMRRLQSNLNFSGIKIPGRTLSGGLTFVGLRTDDAQPEPPGSPWAWHVADNIVGLNDGDNIVTWEDLSGNSNDLTAAGIQSNGASSVIRPKFYSAGHALGMANVDCVRFPNTSGAPNAYAFFNYAAAKTLNAAGWTFAFVFVSPGAGANPRFLNYKHTDAGTLIKDYIADTSANNTSQFSMDESGTRKYYGNSHTFYSNLFGGNPNTIGRYVFRRGAGIPTQPLKQWFNGTDISNSGPSFSCGQPMQISCFGVFGVNSVNYVGQDTAWICSELIVYDYALSDSEVTDLNNYLATRV